MIRPMYYFALVFHCFEWRSVESQRNSIPAYAQSPHPPDQTPLG